MNLLVIGGTHDREIGFSHPTVDTILREHGITSTPEKYLGVDGAKQSLLWKVDDGFYVAKISKTGPLSKEYVESLIDVERYHQLLPLIESWSPDNIYEPAHLYQGLRDWTSVHEHLMKQTHAGFYIDLQSMHNSTKGLRGTSMDICSRAAPHLDAIMSRALASAQSEEPNIYGHGMQKHPLSRKNVTRIEKKRKLNRFQARIAAMAEWGNEWYFNPAREQTRLDVPRITTRALLAYWIGENMSLKEQHQLLTTDPATLDPNYMKKLQNWLNVMEERARSYVKSKIAPIKDTFPYLYKTEDYERNYMPHYFMFEAIKWQDDQQQATARFIDNYLLAQLR